MRRWIPYSSVGRWIGLVLLLIVLVGVGLIGVRLLDMVLQPPELWPVGLNMYWHLLGFVALLVLAGALAYRVVSAFTLAYTMDRNGLYLSWMGNRAVVPLSQIERMDVGASDVHMPFRPLQGIGYYSGQGRTADGRPLHLFATQPPARCLIIYTETEAYAISPAAQDAFVQDLEQRRNLGAVKTLTPTLQSGRIFLYAFWNDRVIRAAVVIALLLNLVLLGYLAARYQSLAPMVEMRFNAAGLASGEQPRHQVLFLPLAALGLYLFNLALGLSLYLREKAGARLLQITSVLVQVLFGIAVVTIIAR